jgi:hypothetical protein
MRGELYATKQTQMDHGHSDPSFRDVRTYAECRSFDNRTSPLSKLTVSKNGFDTLTANLLPIFYR